jgi:hypothetical protein
VDPVLRYHAAAVFSEDGQEERAADELEMALKHRFTLSPAQLEDALALAGELGVAVPGVEG